MARTGLPSLPAPELGGKYRQPHPCLVLPLAWTVLPVSGHVCLRHVQPAAMYVPVEMRMRGHGLSLFRVLARVHACGQMCERWRASVSTDRRPGPAAFHSGWAFCLATFHTPAVADGTGCGGSPGLVPAGKLGGSRR